MKNHKQTITWTIIFALIAAGGILLSYFACSDWIGFSINTACIVSMGIMIAAGITGLRKNCPGLIKLGQGTQDLIQAKQKLNDLYSNEEFDVEKFLSSASETDKLFQTDALYAAFDAHKAEVNRLYRDDRKFRCADIADYINQNLLNQIANASLNDLIAGSMTGIGILGTFIGLIIGLRDFDSSSAEAMMLTIPPLIDGIKVAFITSIFGVIYSISYNIFYHSRQEAAARAMDDFLEEYYKDVLPRPDNDGFTQLIEYQQNQTENMSQFAEQISLTMANALGNSVVPTFQKIQSTINKLSDRLAETQSQNMGKIADQFVKNLDKSMGNQLQHLGENIQVLCQWQDTTMGKMQETIDQFQQTGSQLNSVSDHLTASIQSMQTYIEHIEEANKKVEERLELVTIAFDNILAQMKPQQEAMSQILSSENHVLESMDKVGSSMKTQLDTLNNTQDVIRSYNEEFLKTSSTTLQALQENANNIVTSFTEVLKNSVRETIGTVTSAMDAQIQQVQANMNSINETQQTMHSNHEKFVQMNDAVLQQLQESADSVIKSMNEALQVSASGTIESVTKAMDTQVQQIQANMRGINQTQESFVTQMSDASKRLSQSSQSISAASEDLTANLDKAMSRTYQEIDKQLAEIMRHLSGTIADIRDITDTVPRMLNAAAEQHQKSTESYLKSISDSQRQILNYTKNSDQNSKALNR